MKKNKSKADFAHPDKPALGTPAIKSAKER